MQTKIDAATNKFTKNLETSLEHLAEVITSGVRNKAIKPRYASTLGDAVTAVMTQVQTYFRELADAVRVPDPETPPSTPVEDLGFFSTNSSLPSN